MRRNARREPAASIRSVSHASRVSCPFFTLPLLLCVCLSLVHFFCSLFCLSFSRERQTFLPFYPTNIKLNSNQLNTHTLFYSFICEHCERVTTNYKRTSVASIYTDDTHPYSKTLLSDISSVRPASPAGSSKDYIAPFYSSSSSSTYYFSCHMYPSFILYLFLLRWMCV